MQVFYKYPGEFGNNQGNEMFRGQSAGFTQNSPDPVGGASEMQPAGQSGAQENGQRRRGRGFASMDPERVSEIASMGGKAAHAQGVAHEWTTDEARAAGRKGGQSSRGARSAGKLQSGH
ncbi:MAG: KGG domain-containing protein [bacterium]|nr:KGG domain-containing protein [bacterium]